MCDRFFIPIPYFVFDNMSPELERFIKKLPNHVFLADYCKPSRQLKNYRKSIITKTKR